MLQQLSVTAAGLFSEAVCSTSFDLEPVTQGELPTCETDIVAVLKEPQSDKTCILIGECKDRGEITQEDVENLRAIADAFPANRFIVYVLLAKLIPFSAHEIERAKSLNTVHRPRVIMLTNRELEPYSIYERTTKELGLKLEGFSAKTLAESTYKIYFEKKEETVPEQGIGAANPAAGADARKVNQVSCAVVRWPPCLEN